MVISASIISKSVCKSDNHHSIESLSERTLANITDNQSAGFRHILQSDTVTVKSKKIAVTY